MNRVDIGNVPFIKVALIGDSGVGKSTLSSVLSTGCFESSPIYRPTIGCVIYVLHAVHETQGKYFVELWDLGGNPRFRDARPICYEDCDGYIFLWDSSSEVTYHSLQTWLGEVSKFRNKHCMDSNRGVRGGDDFLISRGSSENQENDASNLESGDRRISIQSNDWENADISLPLLIVGNKIDKLSATEKLALQTACPQQVFVSSRSEDDYDPSPFLKFFDEVYDKGRQQAGQGQGHSLNYPAVIPSSMSTSDDRVRSSSSAATPLSTPTKARNSNSNSNGQPSDNDIEKSVREEVTWSSPLRGFTSSLFSLSASSLRYRVLTNGHTNGHTPDHTHSTEKM